MTEDRKIFEEQRQQLNKSVKKNENWKFKEIFPTISAYTTTYNCLSGQYPFEKAIRSFAWANQLVVVDGGSTDGTREKLTELQRELPNLEVYDIPIDWDNPGKDGQQKAMSRAMTTSEFVIQFDADEICLGDINKWKRIAKDMADDVDIIDLIVIEPFGSITSVRLNKEHNPVKWRVFRNKPEISHGIPKHDKFEKDGKVYSKGMSDGCFPIHIVSEILYPSKLYSSAKTCKELYGTERISEYQAFLQKQLAERTPAVLHVGHVDLEKKIKLYLNSWHKWWCGLYARDLTDPKNNLYFPGVDIKDVTDQMIKQKVEQLIKSTQRVELPELSELDVWVPTN